MPSPRAPAAATAMQVRHMFAHPRKHVANVRSARAFGHESFLERRNLVDQVRQRAAGVGLRRFVVGIVCAGRV